jgi:hypothetical protein
LQEWSTVQWAHHEGSRKLISWFGTRLCERKARFSLQNVFHDDAERENSTGCFEQMSPVRSDLDVESVKNHFDFGLHHLTQLPDSIRSIKVDAPIQVTEWQHA